MRYGEGIRDVALHYLTKGSILGLDPHPLFNTKWYLSQNLDVVDSGVAPFFHYLAAGEVEGRMPHPLFEPRLFEGQLSSAEMPKGSLINYYTDETRNFDLIPVQLFDGRWYRKEFLSSGDKDINPLIHYLTIGCREGLNPSPNFYESLYRDRYGVVLEENEPGLLHYAMTGQYLGFSHIPDADESRFDISNLGQGRWESSEADGPRKTVLAVGHAATNELYGAERSLIDALKCVDASKFRVVLALPTPTPNHVEMVKPFVDQVYAYSGQNWRRGFDVQEPVVGFFEELISSENADLVYVNTILVREPHIAAKRLGVPSVCHVRELISHDEELARVIGEAPEVIAKKVSENATEVIANSKTTASLFDDAQVSVVHNAIDIDQFNVDDLALSGPIKVGFLSANTKKKGLQDYFDLAVACEERGVEASFLAFGPETDDAKVISLEIQRRGGPKNFSFEGYIPNPIEALGKLDLVVNFSHFGESFGRTVVEAMAATRGVIAYMQGALPEIVGEGGVEAGAGALIPLGKPLDALPVLEALLKDRQLLIQMGERGRKRAERYFSYDTLKSNINDALIAIGERYDASPLASAYRKRETVSVIVPNFNYAQFLPQRLESIFQQSYLPHEVIFLDDASTDNSIDVATTLLNKSGIPFKILANEMNEGIYAQWRRGIEVAAGDWVWIAEADDSCRPHFLEYLLRQANDDTNIAFSQSEIIDQDGTIIGADNRKHTQDISISRWLHNYKCSGVAEVMEALAFRNTIPNASAAILRRKKAFAALPSLNEYKFVGDWAFYASILRDGNVSFIAEPMNKFRRHSLATTKTQGKTRAYLQEVVTVQRFICEHYPLTNIDYSKTLEFLDKDYSIDGLEKNSSDPEIQSDITFCKTLVGKRKRWAFISMNRDSFTGGSEVLWREAALKLRKAGDDVVVVCKKWEPMPAVLLNLEKSGIRLHWLQNDGLDELVKASPDMTVVSIGDQDDGAEIFARLQSAGLPYAILNQLTKPEEISTVDNRTRRRLKNDYLKAQGTFFTSKNNLALMEKRIQGKLENAYIHFNPFHLDRNVHLPFPSRDEGFQIAVPSKLHCIHKGQDLLIEVLSQPKWRNRNVAFNLYGEGIDEKTLRSRVEERRLSETLIFKGRVDDIGEIWASNHALCMPSRMEGMPIMLISAMVCARLPIHTNVGGAAEVIEDGQNGFLAEKPSIASIDDALERAWKTRHDWEEMGQSARQKVLTYLPDDPVANFLEQLRAILN